MVLIMGISQASSNFIFPSLNLHYLTALWLLPESISEDFVVPIWLNLPVGAIAPVCPLAKNARNSVWRWIAPYDLAFAFGVVKAHLIDVWFVV